MRHCCTGIHSNPTACYCTKLYFDSFLSYQHPGPQQSSINKNSFLSMWLHTLNAHATNPVGQPRQRVSRVTRQTSYNSSSSNNCTLPFHTPHASCHTVNTHPQSSMSAPSYTSADPAPRTRLGNRNHPQEPPQPLSINPPHQFQKRLARMLGQQGSRPAPAQSNFSSSLTTAAKFTAGKQFQGAAVEAEARSGTATDN